MTRLAHFTLATGHLAMHARADTDDLSIVRARRVLEEAQAASPGAALLPFGPYSLGVERFGSALFATVLGELPGDEPRAIVAFGIAPRARAGHRVWRQLGDLHRRVWRTAPPAEPPAPWCSVVMLPGLLEHPQAAEWLAGFETALAWAWIERPGEA